MIAREFDRLKKPDARSFKLQDVLTAPTIKGYRTALVNFIVGGSIQRINGIKAGGSPKKLRYSFLLHSEASKDAHDWQETLTKTIVDKFRAAAEENSPIFVDLMSIAYKDFSRSLSLKSEPIPDIREVLSPIDLVLPVAQRSQDFQITIL